MFKKKLIFIILILFLIFSCLMINKNNINLYYVLQKWKDKRILKQNEFQYLYDYIKNNNLSIEKIKEILGKENENQILTRDRLEKMIDIKIDFADNEYILLTYYYYIDYKISGYRKWLHTYDLYFNKDGYLIYSIFYD